MLGSFSESFRKRTKYKVAVPKAIIKSLSKKLPDGLNYFEIEKGICTIKIPEDATVEGDFEIPNATEDNLKKCRTYEDYFFYATNLQSNLLVRPKENGYIYINGNPVRLEDLVIVPYEEVKIVKGGIEVRVPKLDRKLMLDVSIGEKHYSFIMRRVPYDSMDHCKVVNENFPALNLDVVGKIDATDVSISASVDYTKASCIRDVCEGMEIYNGFMKGKAKINGTLVNRKNYKDNEYPEDIVEFWESLEKLERIFDVKFDVAHNRLDADDVELIKQLTSSLIYKEPYRNRNRIASISGDITEEMKETLGKDIGKRAVFQYVQAVSGTLLGAQISFYRLSYLFDTKVAKVDFDEDENRFTAYFASDGPSEYYQVNCEFLHEKDVDDYLAAPSFSVDTFSKAKKLSDFSFAH